MYEQDMQQRSITSDPPAISKPTTTMATMSHIRQGIWSLSASSCHPSSSSSPSPGAASLPLLDPLLGR